MSAVDWRGELAARYPAQLPSEGWLECSAGWFELLDEMFRRVQLVLDADREVASTFRWTQIKSKYGTLRAYANYVVDPIEEAIDRAETRSEATCEVCGQPGELVTSSGWLRTTCGEAGH